MGNIGRTLFWFKDGRTELKHLNDRFFGLATMLNRLMNESYDGKKVKFINVYFATAVTYEIFPEPSIDYIHYYGGHLSYSALFVLEEFENLSQDDQAKYVWDHAIQYLRRAGIQLKNESLVEAVDLANERGGNLRLNPDFPLIKRSFNIHGEEYSAELWIHFNSDDMFSKFWLKRNNQTIMEKMIDQSKAGYEFFLEMYKDIQMAGDHFVITGHRDVEYLPMMVKFPNQVLSHP